MLNFENVFGLKSRIENWEIIEKCGNIFNPSFKDASVKDIYNEIIWVIPEYESEVVIFKNKSLPKIDILKSAQREIVPNGANYIEKWFTEQEKNT